MRVWKPWWNDIERGKPKNWEKACPSATLSNKNSTWTNPGYHMQVNYIMHGYLHVGLIKHVLPQTALICGYNYQFFSATKFTNIVLITSALTTTQS
jgi:hypothetical protein